MFLTRFCEIGLTFVLELLNTGTFLYILCSHCDFMKKKAQKVKFPQKIKIKILLDILKREVSETFWSWSYSEGLKKFCHLSSVISSPQLHWSMISNWVSYCGSEKAMLRDAMGLRIYIEMSFYYEHVRLESVWDLGLCAHVWIMQMSL